VEEHAELFKLCLRHRHEDIMGYRNQPYRCTITGTLAPPLPDHWTALIADSLAAFMTSTMEARVATAETRASRTKIRQHVLGWAAPIGHFSVTWSSSLTHTSDAVGTTGTACCSVDTGTCAVIAIVAA